MSGQSGQAPLKSDLYRDLGYAGDTAPYEQALHEANLTNPRKSRIDPAKIPDVEQLLNHRFIRVCTRGDCRERAKADPREPTPAADQSDCELCGGSINASAVEKMIIAFEAAGWSRLCIVGGSPTARQTLDDLVRARLELRLIDGEQSRTRAQAESDIAWADRVMIWGATELNHAVSGLYTGLTVIQTARRSIAAIASEAAESARRAQGGRE